MVTLMITQRLLYRTKKKATSSAQVVDSGGEAASDAENKPKR